MRLGRFEVYTERDRGFWYEFEQRSDGPQGWDFTAVLGWFQMVISYTSETAT